MSTATYFDEQMSAHLAKFGAAEHTPVLSFLDEDGDPFSLRCKARWTGTNRFALTSPVFPSERDGSPRLASLLWHHHDEALEDQRSILLLGQLLLDDGDPTFEVTKKPILSGIGEVDYTEMFAKFERTAEQYLIDYSLEPPELNWETYERLVAEVRSSD